MTKAPASLRPCNSTLGLLIPLFLLFGCASTPRPERPIQSASVSVQLPERKVEAQHSETTIAAEQNAIAEVDEKSSIFFSLGSSTIHQREKEKLRDLASLLTKDKTMYVMLIGHANDNGSRSFNLAVADARVEAVSRFLRKFRVQTHQIKKNVIGGEKISSTCLSQECRRKMRRVEFIISTDP